jgi:peptidoglycan/LPS O-acetylase OafA/YrhL
MPASAPSAHGPALADAGGLVVLAAMAYAPLAMGAQPPWAWRGLQALASVAFVLWAVGVGAERRRPAVPRVLVVSVLVVLALGWASALLPRSTYDPAAR